MSDPKVEAFINAAKTQTLEDMMRFGRVAQLVLATEQVMQSFEMTDRMIALAVQVGVIIASVEAVGPTEYESAEGVIVSFDDRLRLFTEEARIAYETSMRTIKEAGSSAPLDSNRTH